MVKSIPLNEEKSNKDQRIKERTICGISVIDSIVSKTISSPQDILSGLKQILFFYQLLPPEWKEKAFWIFEKLWKKKQVVVSTDPEQAEKIYGVSFGDEKLNRLLESLPQVDQAIMIQGKTMLDLINKGLHGDSDEVKREVEERYGQRGLNIVNMLTTRDVQYLLEEINEPAKKEDFESRFNEWAYKYDSISVLVSPSWLTDFGKIKESIIKVSKHTIKDYVLVNLSGKMEDCTKLLQWISDLKENKELNYINFDQDISDSGFCKSLRVKINFKKKR